MAPLLLKQLTILLWKCWVMRKCHYISTFFELVFPLVITIIMVYIRANDTRGRSATKNYDEYQPHAKKWVPPTKYWSPEFTINPDSVFQYRTLTIYYTPETNLTARIMDHINHRTGSTTLTIVAFDSEEEIIANLTSTDYYSSDKIGVIFENANDNDAKSSINYKIRTHNYFLHYIGDILYPTKYGSGPYQSSHSEYQETNFIRIQIAINEAYMNYIWQTNSNSNGTNNSRPNNTKVERVMGFKIPYPAYMDSGNSVGGSFSLQYMIAVMLINGYIAFVPLIVKRITDEKVAKAKEMLRMMGMSDWVFWGSHFVNYFLVMTVHNVLYTLMYFIGWGGTPFFIYSDGFLFFCIMTLFSVSTILFSMLITTLFNRPVIAVVITVIIYNVECSVPMSLLSPIYKESINIDATQDARILSCLLPNMGLIWAFDLIGQCENYHYGANWGNLWQPVSNYGRFNIGYVMLMMLISCFIYGVLIWYIDNVWPFQYGIPKPVYYIFQPSYWRPKRTKQEDNYNFSELKSDEISSRFFEKEPQQLRAGISCVNLRKSFGGKMAVNNVSLNIYTGQITVLLGHNGAGKTTTMNMITGIFPPSDGTAFVDGYDINHQTREARRSMALCPQENILYNELNVYQHLKLYAILKDHPWYDLNNEIQKMLQMVALTDKATTMSTALSGGMKRKLSLAIAMIANTKILILDEPTSGMDPEARRHIWDVLQGIRCERTILLTTHYMEEADILGDRIAIMSEGLVKCYGSPLFLKKIFGAGYHLRVSKGHDFMSDTVLDTIRNYIPSAQIKSDINTEIIYSLENDDNYIGDQVVMNSSSQLASLFDELEKSYRKLGINSCGLTVTTMEDVFLKVGNDCIDNDQMIVRQNGDNSRQYANGGSNENILQSLHKNYGRNLVYQQFIALLLKRFHYAKRYWPMIVMQTILPAILFMCILLIDNAMKQSMMQSMTSLTLDLSMYGSTKGIIKSNISDLSGNNRLKRFYTEVAGRQSMAATNLSSNDDINDWYLTDSGDIMKYIKTYLVGAEVNQTLDGRLSTGSWFNNEAYHSLPISVNILYETLLKYMLPNVDTSITVHTKAIPYNTAQSNIDLVFYSLIITCLLLVPITVPFIGASYALFPIHERVTNSKLLQLMTGLSSITFWTSSLLFDLINHLLACSCIFLVIAIFDWNHVFIGQSGIRTGLFFMLFLFGFASIPFAYLFSFVLKKPSSGFAGLVIINLVCGIVLVLPLGVFDYLINSFHGDFMKSSDLDIILFFCRFLPVFSMSFGIQKLYKIGSFQIACKNTLPVYLTTMCNDTYLDNTKAIWGCCVNKCRETGDCYDEVNSLAWGTNGVAIEFTFMIISGFVYFAILLLIEGYIEKILYLTANIKWFNRNNRNNTLNNNLITPSTTLLKMSNLMQTQHRLYSQETEDSDVVYEKRRIEELFNQQRLHEDAIVVNAIKKNYGRLIPVTVVNKLTFGVHKEECFGLLGVNGAGKTTTFRMLTGDETLTAGDAYINYISLRDNLKAFQKNIGYCPQFDALLNKLTGRETIYLFARLRGMVETSLNAYVNEMIKMVDLEKHADKCTEDYSGGNRRKLSLALSLCASPPVIFLDEPTSGVDPAARRKIWSTLVRMQDQYQSSIILTSHSMEECEALCSRIAIMVNGSFKCLGSVQQLRSKFGQGFTIQAKLKREFVEQPAYMTDLQNYIHQYLPSSVLKDVHQCHLDYHITDTSMLWSQMFRVMEEAKSKFSLEDYLIGDTTLEQIFLSFARIQR